jgi:hypothetical protein
MGTKHKQDFLYQPETPIVYKLWKGLSFDNSIVKENLIDVKPAEGNKKDNINLDSSITFSHSDTTKFLNLSSNQSGFITNIKFKTQHKPAGHQTDADPWVDNEPANITLANAWFGHLWGSAKFSLGGTEIENINHFGTVFETLSLLRGSEYLKTYGISESICPDTDTGNTANTNKGREIRKSLYNYDVANDATYRELQAFIPLHSIFGFCQDYNRVIRNMPLEIIMTRNTNYKNYVFGADHTNVAFELTSISLQIEQLIPSDTALIAINDFLSKTDTIDVHFRAKGCKYNPNNTGTEISISGFKYSSPRYFILACKDPAKKNNCQQNFGKLENGNISNIKVTLDHSEYPNEQQKAKFNQNQFSKFYNPLVNVCRELYRNECSISPNDFKNIYSIFAIDTSNQAEKGKNEKTDVSIDIARNEPLGIAALDVYGIVIYDRWFKMHLHEQRISELV